MAKRTQYWINSGIVKAGGNSSDGHFRSLDKVVWDILKCCGLDCCAGGYTPGVTKEYLITVATDIIQTVTNNLSKEVFTEEVGVTLTISREPLTISGEPSETESWFDVYKNGLLLIPGVDYVHVIGSTTVTFDAALLITDVVIIKYMIA